MRYCSFGLMLPLLMTGSSAVSAPPNVVVDIAPVYSIVAQVMKGVGEPTLIIRSGASPHDYALRPSEAAAIENANLVFWVGHELTPWLEDPLENLTNDAQIVELVALEGTILLETREQPVFDDHADEHDDHDHEVGAVDPHAWLDPENAKLWMQNIAQFLAEADPDNAGQYAENAVLGQAAIDGVVEEIKAAFSASTPAGYIVAHDAYIYFENRFGIRAEGAVTNSEAASASPSRLHSLVDQIEHHNITCILTEPQMNPSAFENAFAPYQLRNSTIDPLGVSLDLGTEHYPNLLRNMAQSFLACEG